MKKISTRKSVEGKSMRRTTKAATPGVKAALKELDKQMQATASQADMVDEAIDKLIVALGDDQESIKIAQDAKEKYHEAIGKTLDIIDNSIFVNIEGLWGA